MPQETRQIVRIFLASPGDLVDERSCAKKIIDEENFNHARNRGLEIELVGWEDTLPGSGRPQELINKDLEQCDHFVGIVWQRWGTPSSNASDGYTSGFEEEFRLFEKLQITDSKKQIYLFFKTPEQNTVNDPGKQFQKVQEFKREITEGKNYLFKEFGALEFEFEFRRIIAQIIETYTANDNISTKASSRVSEVEPQKKRPEASETGLYNSDVRKFIYRIVEDSNPDENVTASDIARLRLLGICKGRYANDNVLIGVHDANLLFNDHYKYSEEEREALASAGLHNLSTENAPIWHWLANPIDGVWQSLLYQTFSLNTDENRATAIRLLSAFRKHKICPPNIKLDNSELSYLQTWLSKKVGCLETIRAALRYACKFGTQEDLEAIEQYVGNFGDTESGLAVSAKATILARENVEKALKLILQYPAAKPTDEVIDIVFSHGACVDISILINCLDHPSHRLRQQALKFLNENDGFNTSIASDLLKSEYADIRLGAIRHLMQLGKDVSEEQARNLLLEQSTSKMVFGSRRRRTTTGKIEYAKLLTEIFNKKSHKELKAYVSSDDTSKQIATQVRYERFFAKSKSEIKKILEARISASSSEPNESNVKTLARLLAGTSDQPTEDLSQMFLDIFCSNADRIDLDFVRRIVDNLDPSCSPHIIAYFGKYGGAEDIARLCKMKLHVTNYRQLLHIPKKSKYVPEMAQAIIRLMPEPQDFEFDAQFKPELVVEIFKQLPKSRFSKITDELLLNYWQSLSDEIRRTLALKAVAALGKTRVKNLLSNYRKQERVFYNVVFWLDLGVSFPRTEAIKVAELFLNDEI